MNNIEYIVTEKDNNNNNNNNNFEFDIENINDNEIDISEIIAQQVNYDVNYPLKYIINIMDYYQIKKTNLNYRLNKKQMIEKIVEYENIPENYYNVVERKRLFDNYIELKNNKFFSKFIISQL